MPEEVDIFSSQDLSGLRESVDKLTRTLDTMMVMFKDASADIHSEADSDLGKKLDILIEQNQQIARALVMLFELQKEHLPRISARSSPTMKKIRNSVPRMQLDSMPPKISSQISQPPAQSSPIDALPGFSEIKEDGKEKVVRF